jgi:hypothetical protein
LAVESRPTPSAVEVIFRRGDFLPISVTKPLLEMHRAGAVGDPGFWVIHKTPPKAGDEPRDRTAGSVEISRQ